MKIVEQNININDALCNVAFHAFVDKHDAVIISTFHLFVFPFYKVM